MMPNFKKRFRRTCGASGWCVLLAAAGAWGAEIVEADICIYGGTAGGVAAAVQAARMGKRAVIVEAGHHLGGMTSSGLGATDIGNKAAVGGIAREFYQAIARHYAREEAWRFERRQDYFGPRGGPAAISELNSPQATLWAFEPRVAEDIFLRMVNDVKVPVFMILGQSAAAAAALALDQNIPIQELDYSKLRARLLADRQILTWK